MSQAAVLSLPALNPAQPRFASDEALVAGLCERDPVAMHELVSRHGDHVQGVIINLLGYDSEVADLVHEVFVQALTSIDRLRDPACLKAWLTRIAVYTARGCIRSRSRRRWLVFKPNEQLETQRAPLVSDELKEAMRCTYQILQRLPIKEREVFVLRHISGMELLEVAEACDISLSTVKRRLAAAQKRFGALAQHHAALRPWLEGGR